MMTTNMKANTMSLVRWQIKGIQFYAGVATVTWIVVSLFGLDFLHLPVMPITVVGAAIGIFASFRANQAYDRWWEGRKLWGRMINSSRHFVDQAIRYLGPDESELAERLVTRHIVYVHALRCLLRKQNPFDDVEFNRFLQEENADLEGSTNLTHALLDRQLADLVALSDAGKLDGHRLESMDRTLMDLLNIQGGCERIKGTPLPRGYGFIVELLIKTFACMLPFSLVHDVGIVVIPLNVLVCLSFGLISEAGRVLEDPFNLLYNALPLHALSVKIERNLRERLGHEDLPPAIGERIRGVLM